MNALRKRYLWNRPRQLPVGRQEFEQLYQDVISLSPAGIPDNRSVRFALAQMVTTAPQAFLPIRYFIEQLIKVAANQVGSTIFNETKEAQKKEWADETARSNAEAAVTNEAIAQVASAPSETKH